MSIAARCLPPKQNLSSKVAKRNVLNPSRFDSFRAGELVAVEIEVLEGVADELVAEVVVDVVLDRVARRHALLAFARAVEAQHRDGDIQTR